MNGLIHSHTHILFLFLYISKGMSGTNSKLPSHTACLRRVGDLRMGGKAPGKTFGCPHLTNLVPVVLRM